LVQRILNVLHQLQRLIIVLERVDGFLKLMRLIKLQAAA